MSLYIHAENQRLLWNTIQQVPQFQQINHINKEVWFSNIIKQFYQTVQYLPQLSPQDLQQLNRQTISYMVNDLKKMTQPFTLATDNFAGSLYAKPKYAESQQTIHAYSSRQNDYEMMSKPKVPPVADFSEKFDDETITNMDELVQQQIKQREYDIARVKEQLPQHSGALKIQDPVDLDNIQVVPTPDAKKAVSWSNGNEIDELRNQVNEMTKKLDAMYTKIDMLTAIVPSTPQIYQPSNL